MPTTRRSLSVAPPYVAALGFAAALGLAPVIAQSPSFSQPPAGNGPAPRHDTAIAFDPVRARTVLFGGPPLLTDTWEWDGVGWIRRNPTVVPPNTVTANHYWRAGMAHFPGVGVALAGEGVWNTHVWNGSNWSPVTWSPSFGAAVAYHAGQNPGLLHAGDGIPSETWRFDGSTWSLVVTGSPQLSWGTIAFSPVTNSTFGIRAFWQGIEMWRWDGSAWHACTNLGTPHNPVVWTRQAMTWDSTRGVFVVVSGASTYFAQPLSETPNQVYWTSAGSPGMSPPYGARSTYDSVRRRVVLVSGVNGPSAPTPNPLILRELPSDSATWIDLSTTGPAPSARSYCEMSFEPSAGTLLFGGWDGTQPLADTWSFDGNRWTNRGTSTAPARYGTALCRFNMGTVMFGGGNAAGTYMQDLRAWNGSDWAPVFMPLSPTPAARMNHDMAYDSANNRVVMFGGRSNSSFNDTWVLANTLSYIPWLGFWFGPQWMEIGGNAPPARNSHRMAYDAQRGRVVMFGGCSASGAQLSDTWELVGDTWQQVFPPQSPSPRWNHAMEYDPVRGVVVLIGGYANGWFPDDVWEYDGVTWTQRTPQSTTPGGREGTGCTWDPRIQRMVLRSGYSWATGLNGDTWFYHGH